jgi:hypothetical protein
MPMRREYFSIRRLGLEEKSLDGGVLVPEPADGKLADVAVVVGELDAVVVDDLGSAVAAGAFELDRTPGR